MYLIKVNARADATGDRRVVTGARAVGADKSEKGGDADITEPPLRAIAGLKLLFSYIKQFNIYIIPTVIILYERRFFS